MKKPTRKKQTGMTLETVPLDTLKPHPRNYRTHPEDQMKHLMASIKAHGCYRNIVVAKDGTILAGHGVTEALRRLKWDAVPIARLPIASDSAAALKIVVADNEISHLSEIDDHTLIDLLKDIGTDGLLGTGYDEAMLSALMQVTQMGPIKDDSEAWVGLPGYERAEDTPRLVVCFRSAKDRDKFIRTMKIEIGIRSTAKCWSAWWPPKAKEDPSSIAFEVE